MSSLDPYKVLDVPLECTDIKLIKRAYCRKRKKAASSAELMQLRKCYADLKRMHTPRSSGGVFEEQLANDNSMIVDEGFNVDRLYKEMLRDRPNTLSYDTLLQTSPSNRVNPSVSGVVDGFGGFDQLDNPAPILTDGRFMFVQGTAAAQRESAVFQPLLDDSFQRLNASIRKTTNGKLDKGQIQRYMEMRDQALDTADRPTSGADFHASMRQLDEEQRDLICSAGKRSAPYVQGLLAGLSEETRNNLYAYDAFQR